MHKELAYSMGDMLNQRGLLKRVQEDRLLKIRAILCLEDNELLREIILCELF